MTATLSEPTMVPTSEPRRDYRTLVALALAVLVVLFAFFGRRGWYFSVQVGCDTLDATDQPNTNELSATAVGSDALRIEGTAEDPLPYVLRTDAVHSVRPADGAVVLTYVIEKGRQLGGPCRRWDDRQAALGAHPRFPSRGGTS